MRSRWLGVVALRLFNPVRKLECALPRVRSIGLKALLLAYIPAFAFLCGVGAGAQQRPGSDSTASYSVQWVAQLTNSNQFTVEVTGLSVATLKELQASERTSAQWQRLLAVYAEQGDLMADIGLPPMLGTYGVQSGALRFDPQFPLDPAIHYRAMFQPGQLPGASGSGGKPVTATFQLPRRGSTPTTVVRQVYPNADVLPENLLKFYVHFSAPMSGGHIYSHIHLRDEAGKEIELPFLEIDEELWNPAMTRLTLFIDPGRIKRGVRPLEEIGPSLEAGKHYTLVLDREWKDAARLPLRETFQKKFQVGPPDRDPPDPAHWKLQPPKSGTTEPLTVVFPEPMDHALALRLMRVVRESGELIDGTTALEDQDRRWMFVPSSQWPRGACRLIVQTTIEDLAGNNIGKAFEVDLVEPVQRRMTNSSVKLPFEVR